jgi:hypothetical protein
VKTMHEGSDWWANKLLVIGGITSAIGVVIWFMTGGGVAPILVIGIVVVLLGLWMRLVRHSHHALTSTRRATVTAAIGAGGRVGA